MWHLRTYLRVVVHLLSCLLSSTYLNRSVVLYNRTICHLDMTDCPKRGLYVGHLLLPNQHRPLYDNRLCSAEKVAQPLLKASAGTAVGSRVIPEEDSAGYREHKLVPVDFGPDTR
jgi:hypothetical protein